MSDATDTPKHTYVEMKRKIEDAASAAWSFTLLGALGFAGLILTWTGILPVEVPFTTLLLGTIVLGILFFIFILAGIRAFMDKKALILAKSKEDSSICQIRRWFSDHYSADAISHGVDEEDLPMEQLYFIRSENITRLLAEQFPELEESFAEHMVENIYQMYFPD